MTQSAPTPAQPIIPAATVLLVREAPALEVLMVVRHHQIDFASGALVFPGGKLAREDHDPAWAEAIAAAGIAVPQDLAYRIAAIREAFEESGQLLARAADGRPGTGEAVRQVRVHRAAIAAETGSFLEAMRAASLIPDVGALQLYAHWITPEGMPKRFDTLFYLAVAPADQIASEDGREAVEACWVAPHAALADAAAGRRTIIFPTRLNVELLSEAGNIAAAKAQTAARAIIPVTPAVVLREGVPWLTIPAEAGYKTTEEPLEGNRP